MALQTATGSRRAPGPSLLPMSNAGARAGQCVWDTHSPANPGTWTYAGTPAFSYQWLRNGVAIGGATTSTYRLVAADAARQIHVRVRGIGRWHRRWQHNLAPAHDRQRCPRGPRSGLPIERSGERPTRRPTSRPTPPSGATRTGSIGVFDRTRRIKLTKMTAAHRGQMTIVLPRLARGTHYISIRYYGNTQIAGSTTAKVSLVVSN